MALKRILSFVLTVFLLTAVCGCSSGFKAESPVPDPVLPDLAAAMAGEKTITFHPHGGLPCEVTVDGLPAVFNPDADEISLSEFTVTDLDGDGRPEAVVRLIAPAGDLGGFAVLYWYDGELRGYPVDYRYFESLKTDGSFFFTVTDNVGWGVGKMDFQASGTGGGYSVGHTFWQEPLYEAQRWYDGERGIEQESFERGIAEQEKKPDAPWYSFDAEGLASAFPG